MEKIICSLRSLIKLRTVNPPKETLVGAEAALNHGRRAAVREARQHVRRPWRRRRRRGRTKTEDEAETEHSGVLPESHGVSIHMGN